MMEECMGNMLYIAIYIRYPTQSPRTFYIQKIIIIVIIYKTIFIKSFLNIKFHLSTRLSSSRSWLRVELNLRQKKNNIKITCPYVVSIIE